MPGFGQFEAKSTYFKLINQFKNACETNNEKICIEVWPQILEALENSHDPKEKMHFESILKQLEILNNFFREEGYLSLETQNFKLIMDLLKKLAKEPDSQFLQHRFMNNRQLNWNLDTDFIHPVKPTI